MTTDIWNNPRPPVHPRPPSFGGGLPVIEQALIADTAKLAPLRVSIPVGKKGKWSVRKFNTILGMEQLRLLRDGRPAGIGKFTALVYDDVIVMSDTNAEIRDFIWPVWAKSKGRILVTGLGLGCVVQALLLRGADEVTVVEKSRDVISLVAPTYRKKFGKRFRIFQGDAYTWKPVKDTPKFDWAWHDIWTAPGTDDLKDMDHLKRHHAPWVKRGFGNQKCWAQDWIKFDA